MLIKTKINYWIPGATCDILRLLKERKTETYLFADFAISFKTKCTKPLCLKTWEHTWITKAVIKCSLFK